LFRKGLDPGTLPFQNASSNPNGTQEVSHAEMPQGSTQTELRPLDLVSGLR
jgi:hypothetical protein